MKRRDLLAASSMLAAPALFAAGGPKIPNTVVPAGNAKVTHEPFGDLAIYFSGATDQIKQYTAGSLRLKPGMEPHPPHEHPEEEFMVITEGTGEIYVDGKTVKVMPGSMMFCAGGKTHGIKNTGKEPLLFYFYKWKA